MTGVVVVVAGIGIGASTATFSVLDAVLLRPLPYPEADRLVQISETNPDQLAEADRFVQISETNPDQFAVAVGRFRDGPVNALNYLDCEAGETSSSNMAWVRVHLGVRDRGIVGGGEGAPQVVEMMNSFVNYVSPEYFRTLGIPIVRGEGLPAWDGSTTQSDIGGRPMDLIVSGRTGRTPRAGEP